jgi:acyl carrier protein
VYPYVEQLQEILSKEFNISLKDTTKETTFKSLAEQDNSFDSLNIIQYIIDVEDYFGITIPAEIQILTIGDLVYQIGLRSKRSA